MTFSGDFVGTMRVSSKPDFAKRARNSSAVRSRPPGIIPKASVPAAADVIFQAARQRRYL